MNGKRYSTSQKHRTGLFSTSITIIFMMLVGALLLGLVFSAAALYQPNTLDLSTTQSNDIPTTSADLEYIRQKAQQEAIAEYYAALVGCEDISTLVLGAAQEYDIADVEVLFALMWKESSFRTTAVNQNASSVDRGLFQLNSNVYSTYPADRFFDIEWNIRTGVRHYATELQVANGNHQIALHAYNAGRSRRYTPPSSTQRYAIEVLQLAQRYRDEKEIFIQSAVEDRLAMYNS